MLKLVAMGGFLVPRGWGGGDSADLVSQSDINQIILNQLNALGERLDNIEKKIKVQKVPKKTGDMSKIKFSAKQNKGTKAQVTQPGFEQSVAHT